MKTRIKTNRICIAYPTGTIKFFTLMILGIIMMSCNSHSKRRVTSEKITKESELITDDVFINNINSFDSTAVVHDLYFEPKGDINILCIVIKQNDSLFLYKGTGSYIRRYYTQRIKGDFAKQ